MTTPSVPAWERRFRAARVSLPQWARDAPDRCAVVATAGGVLEVHSWIRGGPPVRATARREGTARAAIDPSGSWLWWFDDTHGDEFGVWRRQPFGSGPDGPVDDPTGLPAAYPAGLALGRDGRAVVGRSADEYGTEISVVTPGAPPRLLYASPEDAGVGALSEDGTLVAISHSEHGDSRHPALRVLRVADGTPVADLADGPGRGLDALGFAPAAGDARLLVRHERHGRDALLVWDVAAGTETEVAVDGEVAAAEWYPDGTAVLVTAYADARTRLHRVEPASGAVTAVGPDTGCVLGATVRPDGEVWTSWSSAWRDALEARVGHVELEDVVAVRDHLVATGVADPDRVLLTGASWGGYLTLLGLGTYPDRWAAGIAGVPVADYVAAYDDEMEGLKAFDRSLFGGSPAEVPERYWDSSPLTYADAVRVPVLVLAGENDPRCPIRQIENYLAVLTAPHEVYRFDAGHGSLVDDERVAQMRVELDFAARHGIGTGAG